LGQADPPSPEGEENQTPEGETGAQDNIEEQRRETQQETRSSLGEGGEGGESGESEEEETGSETANALRKMEELRAKISETHSNLQNILVRAGSAMPSENKEHVLKVEIILNQHLSSIDTWIETLQTIKAFEEGRLPFGNLLNWLNRHIKDHMNDQERNQWKDGIRSTHNFLSERRQTNQVTSLALKHMHRDPSMDTLDESTRAQIDEEVQTIVDRVKEYLPLQDIVSSINEGKQEIEDSLGEHFPKITSFVKDITKEMDDKGIGESSAQGGGRGKGLLSFINMRLYSPLEIWASFKTIKDAYLESYRQHTQLKSSGLAQGAGHFLKWLPWAGDIEQILDSQLDKANDEVKESYLNFLKNHKPSFRSLFDLSGEMDRNMHDGNRSRAVLEYAASRGWLYDISKGTGTILGKYNLHDILSTLGWNEKKRSDYIDSLTGQNGTGSGNEQQEFKTRYANINSTERFIELFDRELSEGNMWGAIGIADKAMDRCVGTSDVSPWLATTFMRHIRENPLLRKYINDEVLDAMGILSLYKTYFTLGKVKLDKEKIEAWVRRGDTRLANAGILGNIIQQIEEDITKKAGGRTVSSKAMDHMVARVLATNTVEVVPGNYVSIYDSQYAQYHEGPHENGTIVLNTEDEGYYRAPSDTQMGDQMIFDQILVDSNGVPSDKGKYGYFIGTILANYLDMQSKFPEAAENYRRQMGKRLGNHLKSRIKDARTDPLMNLKATGMYRADSAWFALYEKGFFREFVAKDEEGHDKKFDDYIEYLAEKKNRPMAIAFRTLMRGETITPSTNGEDDGMDATSETP